MTTFPTCNAGRRWAAALTGLALVALLGLPARADKPAGSEARLRRDMKFLASDACEGRGITTKGINLAAEYIAREFQSAGLKPGGPDGTFYQPFSLTTGGKLGDCRLALRGPLGQNVTLEQDRHFSVSLQGGSGKAESPIVFAGYGITSTTPKYDDYAGLDAAGKVVIVLTGTPRAGNRYADDFAEATEGRSTSHASLSSKIANSIAHKAAAVLLVSGRPAPRFLDALPRPRISLRDGEPFRIPVAHLRRDQAERMLVNVTGSDLSQIEKDIDTNLKPRSVALPGWTARMQTEITHTRVTVKNVIGVLDGGGPLSQETVVIGAHYDHIGMGMGGGRFGGFGNAVSGPGAPGGVGFPLAEMGAAGVHHGADDNASGTCAVMEMARRFGSLKDRKGRRLVFLCFTAEESGLIGSAYYCRHPVFPLKETAAMVNMDMVGRLQDDKLLVSGLGTAKDFPALLDRLNAKHRFDVVKDPTGQGPSDHASFYAGQVPVLNFFTGFHEQYHRPTDRAETINYAGLKRVVELVGDVAEELCTVSQRPAFVKTTSGFDRQNTLWSMAPSVGVKPDYSHQGEGILVEGVVRGTPAAKAGLKKGDRLVAVAGKPIKDAASFLALTRTIKPGEKIELTVVRDGKEERLAVQLTQPPAPPADVRFGLRLDLNDTRDGILVRSVADNGPAAKAGIRAGDRILRIAGEATRDPISYLNVLRDLEPGAKVDVTVMRSGKEETVKVQTATPRPRPAPPTARFGMTPDFNDDKEGVLVSRVREGSPAEEVGLKPGDRIVAVGGKPVKDVRAYVEVLVGLREGEKVEMTIRRAGKTLKLSVVLK